MRVFLIRKKWLWRGAAVAVVLAVALIFAGTMPASPVFFSNKTQYQIKSVKTEEKCVAITIDTAFGQEDYTQQILEALKKKGAPATFAVMGIWAREYPDAARAIADADMELISHSYAHEHYDSLSKEAICEDAKKAQQALNELGVQSNFIRVPYDSCNESTYQALREIEITPIGYSVEINELEQNAEEIANRVVEQVKPGDILIFQNNSPNTAPAIEEIISRLKSLGYRFETVSGLLGEEYTVNNSGVAVPSQSPVNS